MTLRPYLFELAIAFATIALTNFISCEAGYWQGQADAKQECLEKHGYISPGVGKRMVLP
jgi:hypothetical protein